MTSVLRPPKIATRFAPADVQSQAALFLYREAELYDTRRFHEWLDLVTEDFVYLVPVPRTPDNPFAPCYDPDHFLLDESRDSMAELWFRRYDEDLYELAWGENPPVRLRHFVSNIIAELTGDTDDVYEVRSNVLLAATRQSEQPRYVTAQRCDTLRRVDGALRLARRFAMLDQTRIDFPQPRVLL